MKIVPRALTFFRLAQERVLYLVVTNALASLPNRVGEQSELRFAPPLVGMLRSNNEILLLFVRSSPCSVGERQRPEDYGLSCETIRS